MDRHGSHSQRVPYARKEGRKSLFSKVKESVKDILSPSWLSDLVSNVKKEATSDASETRQQEMNMSPIGTTSGMPQPDLQQHSSSLPFPSQGVPLGNGQPRMMDFASRRPALTSNEGLSQFQQPVIPPPVSEFTSSQLPLARLTEKSDSVLANEDSVSQRSDVSKSTSGCSSMIPQADARRRESGLVKRKATEPEIFNSGSSPSSPTDQPSKRQRLQVSINSSKTWTQGWRDSFSKPQAPAAINRPSFNTSLFGSPLAGDTSILGSSFHDSSFYPGKTTFGGRSSMSFRSKRKKEELNQSLPARLSIPVKAFMKAKPKVTPAREAVTSSTAKRILECLDTMSTPMNDAKKIPLAVPRQWTESPSFFSRDRTVQRLGPPTQRLNISSLATISQNRQVSTPPVKRPAQTVTIQNETMDDRAGPSRDDTIILGGPGAPSGKMRRGKSYHRGSAAAGNRLSLEEEDTEIIPNLTTDFTLPVASMPKFNFATPGPTKTAGTSSKPALNFTFSSPIPESVPVNKPESPETRGGFQFSSPISVDKQPASSSLPAPVQQQEPAKSLTTSSQLTSSQSQDRAPAPFSFSSPLNKPSNMQYSFSEAAAPKPKAKFNGPSSETDNLQPASELKQGSVMDILGGSASQSAFGGVAPASELKHGSVMDILGGSGPKSLSSSTAPKTSIGTGFSGFQPAASSPQSTSFGGSKSETGNQLPLTSAAASTASSLPPLSAMFSSAGWDCDVCLVKNKADADKCVACQSTRPAPSKPKTDSQSAVPLSAIFSSDGWICDVCLVRNKTDPDNCVSCQAPKPKTDSQVGVPLSQMFKKSGWTCDACLVKNNSDESKCVACQSAKPGGGEQKAEKAPPLRAFKIAGWTCDTCLLQNKQEYDKCVACQGSKPASSGSKGGSPGKNDLMAKFKPAVGQWECEVCLVRNKPDLTACAACQTPKPLKSFKHPPGDWTCNTCLVVNKESSVKCVACSYARPGPPRTQTVPSCVKTFTQSQNSGLKSSDSNQASNIVVGSGGGFTFKGGDKKESDTGGFKFGAATSEKTSDGIQSGFTVTGGFKFGGSTVSSTAGAGFKFGDSSDTKSQPAIGGFRFGAGVPTSEKQTSEVKLGGNVEISKPLATGGFNFTAPASTAAQSNSISSENKSVVSTNNSLPGGFSVGQTTESKMADPLKATTSVPGGFTFKPSDSVVNSAKTSEASSQLTSPSVTPSVGGFNFNAASKPQNSLATTSAAASVQSGTVTQNSVGGFTFTATKVTENNSVTVPSQGSESKPAFSGFSFGSTSTNTSQSTTPAFGGFNFAQKPADSSTASSSTNSTSLKRDRDEDSGATEAKKPSFQFGATTSSNTATPFQFGATNSAATSNMATSTSSSSMFAFGKQNTAPSFNFTTGKTDVAPTPVFGTANTSSQFGAGTPAFGGATTNFTAQKTSAPTSSAGSSMFVFGAQSSQQTTTAAAPAFGGFGSTSSFGAGGTPAFGGNAPSTTPAFGATPPAFGSTNTSTAAPAFGGKRMLHASWLSPANSSLLSSSAVSSSQYLLSSSSIQTHSSALNHKPVTFSNSGITGNLSLMDRQWDADGNSILENQVHCFISKKMENQFQNPIAADAKGCNNLATQSIHVESLECDSAESKYQCSDFFAFDKGSDETQSEFSRSVTESDEDGSFFHDVSFSKSDFSDKSKDFISDQSGLDLKEQEKDSLHECICDQKESCTDSSIQLSEIRSGEIELSEDPLTEMRPNHDTKMTKLTEIPHMSKSCQTEEEIAVGRIDKKKEKAKPRPMYKEVEVQTVCFQSTQTSNTQLNQPEKHDGIALQWLPFGRGNCLTLVKISSKEELGARQASSKDMSSQATSNTQVADIVQSGTLPTVRPNVLTLSTSKHTNISCPITDKVSTVGFTLFTTPINTVTSAAGIGKQTAVSLTWSLGTATSTQPVISETLLRAPVGSPGISSCSTPVSVNLDCNTAKSNSLLQPSFGSRSSCAILSVPLSTQSAPNPRSPFILNFTCNNLPSTCNSAIASVSSVSVSTIGSRTTWIGPCTCLATSIGTGQSDSRYTFGCTNRPSMPSSAGTVIAGLSSQPGTSRGQGSFPFGCITSNTAAFALGQRTALSKPVVSSSQSRHPLLCSTSKYSASSISMSQQYQTPTSSVFSWKKSPCKSSPFPSSTHQLITVDRKTSEPSSGVRHVAQPTRAVADAGMEMDVSYGSNGSSSNKAENTQSSSDSQEIRQDHNVFVFSTKSSGFGNATNSLDKSQNQMSEGQAFDQSLDPFAATSGFGRGVKYSMKNLNEKKSGTVTFGVPSASVSQGSGFVQNVASSCKQLNQKSLSMFVFSGTAGASTAVFKVSSQCNKRDSVTTSTNSGVGSKHLMSSSGFVFSPQAQIKPVSSAFGQSSVGTPFISLGQTFTQSGKTVPTSSLGSRQPCTPPFKFSQPIFSSTSRSEVRKTLSDQSSKGFSCQSFPLHSTVMDSDIDMADSDETSGPSRAKFEDKVSSNKFVFSPPITKSNMAGASQIQRQSPGSSLLLQTNEMVCAFSSTRVDTYNVDQEVAASFVADGARSASGIFGGVKDFSNMECQASDIDESKAQGKSLTFANVDSAKTTVDEPAVASDSSVFTRNSENKNGSNVFKFSAKKRDSPVPWLKQTPSITKEDQKPGPAFTHMTSASCFAGVSATPVKNKSVLKLISEATKGIDIAAPAAMINKEQPVGPTSASNVFVFSARSENSARSFGENPSCNIATSKSSLVKPSAFSGTSNPSKSPRPSSSDSSFASDSNTSTSSSFRSDSSSLRSSSSEHSVSSSSETACSMSEEHVDDKQNNDEKASDAASKYNRFAASSDERMSLFAKKRSRKMGNKSWNAVPSLCLYRKNQVQKTYKPLSYVLRSVPSLKNNFWSDVSPVNQKNLGEDLIGLNRPADMADDSVAAESVVCCVAACVPDLSVSTAASSNLLSGGGFGFKPETNNNAPAAPAQSNTVFQFGAKPAEVSQPSAGFNFNPNPAGLGTQPSFNFGAATAQGTPSFSAQSSGTPAGQPERRIKKAVRKIRR